MICYRCDLLFLQVIIWYLLSDYKRLKYEFTVHDFDIVPTVEADELDELDISLETPDDHRFYSAEVNKNEYFEGTIWYIFFSQYILS